MLEWFAANAATVIIGAVVFFAVLAAARYVVRKTKNGECVGCAGCGCGDKEGSHSCQAHTKKQV